ncbi:MAG: S8 family serine peptidase, partial [Armatimonadia bacterium]|nr:S8 family serine peptidase [Armatimonadia bacterium]
NLWVNEDELGGSAGVDDDGNGYVDDINGYDFADGDADPKPRDPGAFVVHHGTHVAGISAAVGNNGQGVAGQAWDCRIMALKVGTEAGGLSFDAVLEAMQYAVDNGADIANLSLGWTSSQPHPTVLSIVQAGAAATGTPGNPDRDGLIWVVALGNGDRDELDRSRPVATETEANEIIGVASVDRDVTRASYSSWSSSLNVCDISAPGGDFDTVQYYSTFLVVEGNDEFSEPYGYMAGTSMASPHTAGICALIRSVDPSLSAAAVRDALLNNSNRPLLYGANPSHESTEALGKGLADAAAAVDAVGTLAPQIQIISPDSGARIKTSTPELVFAVQRRSAKAPAITRVTLRLDPASGDPVGDEDAIWLDSDGDGVDDRPESAEYPYRGQPLPANGRFRVQVDSSLGIGSGGSSLHVIEVTVTDAREPEDYPDTAPDGIFRATSLFRVTAVGIGSGRRMFSMPYELIDRSTQPWTLSSAIPATVFAQSFGGAGGGQIARWDPGAGDAADPGAYVRSDLDGVDDPYISVLQPGKAYWVELSAGTPRLVIQGRSISAPRYLIRDAAYNETGEAADYLAEGWHQIGSPYDFTVSLSAFLVETEEGELLPLAQAVQDGVVRGALYRYADGGYIASVIPEATLEPFEGYWFRTLERCKLYAVPAAAETSSGGIAARSVDDSLAWQFSVLASTAGTDSQVTMASSPRATDGYDNLFDLEQPPPLDADVKLSVGGVEGEGLIRDVRGMVEDEATWQVRASAKPRSEVVLSWQDLRGLPRSYTASLTDEATGEALSMRHEGFYRFTTGDEAETREFTVVVRRVDAATAFRVHVDEASTNARGAATVTFRLTDDAEVDCIVLNAAGRSVRTVAAGETLAAGVRSLTWDGRSDAGAALPAGQYRLEIRARNDRGEVARGTVSISR